MPAAKEETKAAEAAPVRKGPRPRGMKKFTQVKVEEAPIPEEDMSESQKKKAEKQRKKKEEELRLKKEQEKADRAAAEAERLKVAE